MFARPAFAQSETLRVALRWNAEPEAAACVQSEPVQQRVEAQLGHAVFVSEAAAHDVTLSLDAREVHSALQVELEMTREGASLGTRSLEGTSAECAKLIDSLVVVIALLVDVPRPKAVATPAPAPPQAARTVAPPAPAREPSRSTPKPGTSNHLALNAHANLIYGLLPGTAFGFGLDARASFGLAPSFAWRLGGAYWPHDRVAAQGGQVNLSALALEFGFSPLELGQASTFRFRPWLLGSADMLAARGEGFDANRSGYRWLPVLSLSASAEWAISKSLRLSAEPALGFALARPSFLYNDAETGQQQLFRTDFLLFSAQVGLAWRFF